MSRKIMQSLTDGAMGSGLYASTRDDPPEVFDFDCCSDNLPPLDGHRQEGEKYTCPECKTEWEWVEDEAEGGYWAEAQLL